MGILFMSRIIAMFLMKISNDSVYCDKGKYSFEVEEITISFTWTIYFVLTLNSYKGKFIE